MTVDAEYVVPLRWADDSGLDELVAYLTGLRELVDVTVVDGSGPERFAAHARAFPAGVRHLPVEQVAPFKLMGAANERCTPHGERGRA